MKADARRHAAGLRAPSDADLADMAQSALTWHHSLPPGAIRASVAAGWLTLSGEVRWHYQRQDAANCVRDLPGIVGVSDCIKLTRPPASG